MNLYIFTGVLTGYTDGMACVSAGSLEEACDIFADVHSQSDSKSYQKEAYSCYLTQAQMSSVTVLPLAKSWKAKGIIEECWGGD